LSLEAVPAESDAVLFLKIPDIGAGRLNPHICGNLPDGNVTSVRSMNKSRKGTDPYIIREGGAAGMGERAEINSGHKETMARFTRYSRWSASPKYSRSGSVPPSSFPFRLSASFIPHPSSPQQSAEHTAPAKKPAATTETAKNA